MALFDVAFMMQKDVLVVFRAHCPLQVQYFSMLCEGAADVHVNVAYRCLVKRTDPAAVYCTLYFSSPLVYSNTLKD